MARTFGQIKVDIWRNDGFRGLSPEAQRLYLYLVTQPKLSFAGVLSWRPKFAATAASGLTVEHIDAAATELEQAAFIVIDEHTEELLIRSFVRHDELLKSPNLTKAMVSDWIGIDSPTLRGIVAFEVQRLSKEGVQLNGLKNAGELLDADSVDPNSDPFGGEKEGVAERVPERVPERDAEQTQTQTHTQTQRAEAQAAVAAEFDRWYSEYPKKVGKKDAMAAFKRARKTAEFDALMDGLAKYKQAVRNAERRFIANPATWLNQGRWEDELTSPSSSSAPVPAAYSWFNQ